MKTEAKFVVSVEMDRGSGLVIKYRAGGGVAKEDEYIMTVELSLPEALQQIQSKQIADAKTIVGIFWHQKRLTPAFV